MVADEENEVVGCLGGACDDDIGFIYVFYVKPEMKGKGIGGALLDFLTDYQKEQFSITSQEVLRPQVIGWAFLSMKRMDFS